MLKEKLRQGRNQVITLLPYIQNIKNKRTFLASIFLGKIPKKIEFKGGGSINTKSFDFNLLVCLLGAITYSTSYNIQDGKIEFCYDTKNKFTINIEESTREDRTLLELLFWAQRFGANFVTDNDMNNFRDQTFRLSIANGKKIIETSTGIKFYLDSIHAGILTETYVQKIHLINSNDDWKNKTVLDIGANYGDTALYYAQLGATVYAIEAVKSIYEGMLRNLSLNSKLAKKISPINIAVGKFSYELYKNYDLDGIQEYTFEETFEKFGITNIELLKMDCKGCEFGLTKKVLEKVNRIKIEYKANDNSHRLVNLIKLLDDAGFKTMIYRHSPLDNNSNKIFGHIYGFSR